MKIWLPLIETRSGSSVFVRRLAEWLGRNGHEAVLETFPHAFQYAPALLGTRAAPVGAQAVITNSWNGFAFHRAGLVSVCVEHLFVLDPQLAPYKSTAQAFFHERMVRRFVERSYAGASHVAAVSAYTARAIKACCANVDAKVILNGIDTERFTPARRRPRNRSFVLLFAGNPTTRKGADLLPAIMARLGEGFELRITASRDELPALVGASNVRFLGRLAPEAMLEQFRQSDALLCPTRLEGLPLAVLEAMACGLPVIGSDSPPLVEAVIDGECGRTCAMDDVEAYCAAARELAGDRNLIGALADGARARAVEQFSFDRMARQYLDLLGGQD